MGQIKKQRPRESTCLARVVAFLTVMCCVAKALSRGEASGVALCSPAVGPSAGVVFGFFSSSLAAVGVPKAGWGALSEGTPFLARFYRPRASLDEPAW